MGPVDRHRGRLAEPEGRQPRRAGGYSRADTVPVALPLFEIRVSMHHALLASHLPVGDGWLTVVGGKVGDIQGRADGQNSFRCSNDGLDAESREVVMPRVSAFDNAACAPIDVNCLEFKVETVF